MCCGDLVGELGDFCGILEGNWKAVPGAFEFHLERSSESPILGGILRVPASLFCRIFAAKARRGLLCADIRTALDI